MNIPLLDQLRAGGGGFVPLDGLGADLEVLRRDLAELEDFGFRLERHPYHGIAYRGPAERLCPDQIEWGLGTRHVGRRITVWNRVGSTNDLAARAAGSVANAGLVILAEEQTAGRGRRGRSWAAPPRASLLISALLFPPPALNDPAWLTALGAVAVAEVVQEWTGQPARIKWPNDVRVAGRKIAGILVERGPGAVLGIGLNVNLTEADFPAELRDTATSLARLIEVHVDRSELARCLLQRLDRLYEQGLTAGPEPLNSPWRDRLESLGQPVQVQTATGSHCGRLVAADLLRGLTLTTGAGLSLDLPGPEILALAEADEPAPLSPSRTSGRKGEGVSSKPKTDFKFDI